MTQKKSGFYLCNLWLQCSDDLDVANELSDAIGGKGLGDDPVDTGSLLFMRANGFAPTRNHCDRDLFVSLPDLARQFPATHSRHADVSKHAVELRFPEQR